MLSSQWLRSSRGLARRFSSVTEQFKQAISAINNESVPAPRPASNDTKLKMYGYFKQANDGPCTGGAPSMFDPVGRAKYNAWKQLGNLSKEEAMLKYIDEVKTIFNGELPATSTASNSSDASVSNSSTTTIPTAKNGKAIMESIIFKTISNDLTYSTINVSKNENGVFDVQLNRPDRGNSFNMIMWSDLTDSFADINKNSDAKVVVLSGSYGNFSTGMDLSVFVDMQKIAAKETCDARRREGLMKFIEYLQNAISSPENCAVPVIAAVSGHCIGGAVDLITACDMRYCTKDTSFCIKETDLAIVADIGTLQRLPKLLCDQTARELTYTGRTFYGPEAEKIGLVLKCFDTEEEMRAHVTNVATEIANKSPVTIRGVKKTILYSRDHTVHDSLNQVKLWNAAMLFSEDLMEVMKSMMAKEKPSFKKN